MIQTLNIDKLEDDIKDAANKKNAVFTPSGSYASLYLLLT